MNAVVLASLSRDFGGTSVEDSLAAADAHRQAGEWLAAGEGYRRALLRAAFSAEACLGLGLSRLALGDERAALAAFRTLARRAPHDRQVVGVLEKNLSESDPTSGGAGAYRPLLIAPRGLPSRPELGWTADALLVFALLQLERLAAARRAGADAERLWGAGPASHLVGVAALAAGDAPAALAAFNRALTEVPGWPPALQGRWQAQKALAA